MSAWPFYSPKFRAFDTTGNPLAGGLLYTYAAGTTTPQATYTDSTAAVPNANPVVLDAYGQADVWLTPGVNYRFVLKDSSGATQWTEDNVPTWSASTGSTDDAARDPGGRLTLTSGTPVTNTDVTAATSVYYAPYRHDKVPLFDGSNWTLYSIGAGLSQTTADTTRSPAAVVANSNYDLFIWSDAGTVRLSRGPLWTSDTARGTGIGTTELIQVNGRWVNKNSITNGPAANRGLYVGTVRSDGSSQMNDSAALRHVWNTYNRVRRPMRVLEATNQWTYNTAAWRQANASAANQLSMVRGLDEEAVGARVIHHAFSSADTVAVSSAIGLDSITAPDAGCQFSSITVGGSTGIGPLVAAGEWLPGLGHHYLAWLEYGAANSGNTNFTGVTSTTQAGISCEVQG